MPARHLAGSALAPLVLALAAMPLLAAARSITIDNQCSGTIWPAFLGTGATQTDGSTQPAGWSQGPGTYTFNVPDAWPATRLWARTGCTGSGESLSCQIGDCGGTLQCSGTAAGGQGATLAEFTLTSGGLDSYDISIVDGYNLPMEITPSGGTAGGCETASCGAETDLLTMCDPSLVYPAGSDQIWSCASACLANVWFESYGTSGINYKNSPSCCTGQWSDHDSCTKDMIPFYSTYKAVCNGAYIYSDDDNYSDAVYGCTGPDYTITFCPGGRGQGVNPSASAVSQSAGGNIVGASTTETGAGSGPTSTGGTASTSAAAYTSSAAAGGYTSSAAASGYTASTSAGETSAEAPTSNAGYSRSQATTTSQAIASTTLQASTTSRSGFGGFGSHSSANGGGGDNFAFGIAASSDTTDVAAVAVTTSVTASETTTSNRFVVGSAAVTGSCSSHGWQRRSRIRQHRAERGLLDTQVLAA